MGKAERQQRTDSYIGHRLRERRQIFGMAQETLARAIGTSYQQIQRYESGHHQIPANRLWQLCQVLCVSVDYPFAGLEQQGADSMAIPDANGDVLPHGWERPELATVDAFALVHYVAAIRDSAVRAGVVALIRDLGHGPAPSG